VLPAAARRPSSARRRRIEAAVPAAHPRAKASIETLMIVVGVGLILAAISAGPDWFDRHFLPDMFSLRPKQMRLLIAGRAIAAGLGLACLTVLRAWVGRAAGRIGLRGLAAAAAPTLAALVLAVGTTELILGSAPWRAAQEAPADREPLRHRDPRLGWDFQTNHAGLGRPLGGRRVHYAIDAHGYRVARPGDQVDLARPTIVFTGESIIFGHGLEWDETIPAQVEGLTGLQSANIAVEAYAPDQAYLRLASELPRFRQPAAVVTIFIPSLFGRILDDDRPHLDAALNLQPQARKWRLATLAKRLVPYRSPREIDRGVRTTRAIYRATLDLARAHGAAAVIVVPQVLPEPPAARALRRRVLDDAGIPYLLVPLDPRWTIPHNKHPDARGDRAIAEAIVRRLGSASLTSGSSRPGADQAADDAAARPGAPSSWRALPRDAAAGGRPASAG
jgi:hypothetical protein